MNKGNCEICVIGGGLMGSAVALGLVESGAKVVMADKVSQSHKASRGNFGLVWSQSKGGGNRPYARWSEQAVRTFSDFVGELEAASGIDVELRLGAGLILSLGEKEFEANKAIIEKLHREAELAGERHPSRLLDRNEVQELVGQAIIGDGVTGGTFSEIDGDLNPLLLLKAMRQAYQKKGGGFLQGCAVRAIDRMGTGYQISTCRGKIGAEKVVLAGGLGNIELCSKIGRRSHLVPQKGQLLVTARIPPFLSIPCSGIRQTVNGSVMIGYTQENRVLDVRTTVPETARLAARAVRLFPVLKNVRVIRSWASLRVLTEDGLPIYDQFEDHPGIYLLATHSCVTLASLHATILPPWILGGARPLGIEAFTLGRFNDTV